MGNISTEQKLQLIRQVRSQHSRDQSDLMARERLLYGRTGDYLHEGYRERPKAFITAAGDSYEGLYDDMPANPPGRNMFALRLLAALVLLVLFILTDKNNSPFLGISTSEVFSMIENDYYEQLEEWIHETQNER
ncbi:MAG: hypothetical protein IJZ34_14150 [Lachnospiraceae bacterium]|nr:hypothetical protein [Lachnospiraceae bacterium]